MSLHLPASVEVGGGKELQSELSVVAIAGQGEGCAIIRAICLYMPHGQVSFGDQGVAAGVVIGYVVPEHVFVAIWVVGITEVCVA